MDTEQQAAATLLRNGIEVPVTAPLFLRMIGKKEFNLVIGHPTLGTLYRISLICLKNGITDELATNLDEHNAGQLYLKHSRAMARVAAVAWLNGYIKGKLFSGIVSRWLFWHLKPIQLLTLMNVLVVLSNATSFRNTIRLVNGMKMTKPNLSQETQGS